MDHPHRDDEFEGYAPPRRMDGGTRSVPGRPDWLTSAGERDLRDFPPGRTPDRPEMEAPQTGASPPGHEAPPETLKPPGEWENAVEHAAREEGHRDDGFVITSHAKQSRFSWRSGLQSIIGTLSKSPPLVFVALAVIAVVALMMFRPKDEQTVSIAAIHKHPERFDGRPVKVRGRVGEVYEVGGGYAFHLLQGREDLVVFTRSRVPVRREELTIEGSISNGVLDGKERQALFETPH